MNLVLIGNSKYLVYCYNGFKKNNFKKIIILSLIKQLQPKNSYNLKLFANRIPVNNYIISANNKIVPGNTKFTFFVEKNIKPSELITFNNFTKKKLYLEFNKNKDTGQSINNIEI